MLISGEVLLEDADKKNQPQKTENFSVKPKSGYIALYYLFPFSYRAGFGICINQKLAFSFKQRANKINFDIYANLNYYFAQPIHFLKYYSIMGIRHLQRYVSPFNTIIGPDAGVGIEFTLIEYISIGLEYSAFYPFDTGQTNSIYGIFKRLDSESNIVFRFWM